MICMNSERFGACVKRNCGHGTGIPYTAGCSYIACRPYYGHLVSTPFSLALHSFISAHPNLV